MMLICFGKQSSTYRMGADKKDYIMAKTTIEWTGTKNEDGTWSAGYTFNPWWGCTKVSDGCKFCYALSIANRYGHDVWGVGATRRTFGENHWREPVRWNRKAGESGKRLRVFCASMADVFDPEAPADEREKLWDLIRETPHLDWQILTKRPQLIAENLPFDWEDGYPNVWLGTSVEDERVPRAHRATCRCARRRAFSLARTAHRTARRFAVGVHRMGDCRRRKRARRSPDGKALGRRDSAAMRTTRRAVLLQTVGRRAEKTGGTRTQRTFLRRDAACRSSCLNEY